MRFRATTTTTITIIATNETHLILLHLLTEYGIVDPDAASQPTKICGHDISLPFSHSITLAISSFYCVYFVNKVFSVLVSFSVWADFKRGKIFVNVLEQNQDFNFFHMFDGIAKFAIVIVIVSWGELSSAIYFCFVLFLFAFKPFSTKPEYIQLLYRNSTHEKIDSQTKII